MFGLVIIIISIIGMAKTKKNFLVYSLSIIYGLDLIISWRLNGVLLNNEILEYALTATRWIPVLGISFYIIRRKNVQFD